MLLLLIALSALAANLLHMPGDATFSAVLPEEGLTVEGGVVTLEYHRVSQGMLGCGYAGYAVLRIEDVAPALLARLTEAHAAAHLHRFPPPPPGELSGGVVYGPPVILLVVDAGFDITAHSPALRYNERLFEAIRATGHPIKRRDLADPSPEEAALSVAVPGLPLQRPVPSLKGMDAVWDPVTVRYADVRFLVTTDVSLFNLQSGEGAAVVWAVDADGVAVHTLQ